MFAMGLCFVPSYPRLQGIWSCWMEFTPNSTVHLLRSMIFRAIMVFLDMLDVGFKRSFNFHVCCKFNFHSNDPWHCMWGNPSPWPHTNIQCFVCCLATTNTSKRFYCQWLAVVWSRTHQKFYWPTNWLHCQALFARLFLTTCQAYILRPRS